VIAPPPEAGRVTVAVLLGVKGELPTALVVLVGDHEMVWEEATRTIEEVVLCSTVLVTRLSSSKY
jgi:hypothetical protein